MTHRGKLAACLGATLTLAWAGPALAYIGPGAGLSLLGALWAVGAAILAAMLFLLLWPLRRLLRQRRQVSGAAAGPRRAEAELAQKSRDPRID